jgi:hypothetical protein
MTSSTRDRISVDLHGLKAPLVERAQALGVSPSGLVRKTLAEALGRAGKLNIERDAPPPLRGRGDRVRLCLRMSREHARVALEASRLAGLSPGDYIGGLVTEVPVLSAGGSRAEHIATLVASSAELSTLSRNLHRLTALLRQANVEPARPYREMLDTLAAGVRRHLELAARVLADLQPPSRGARPTAHSRQ